MPFQPPTRPHSANPHGNIAPPTLFRPPSSASVHKLNQQQQQQQHHQRSTSSLSLGLVGGKEAEWEDAWDSSSDREDEGDAAHAPRAGPSGGGVSTSRPSASRPGTRSDQSTPAAPGVSTSSSGQAKTDAIPIIGAREHDGGRERQSSSSTTAQSWSSSFQHVQAPRPSPGSRPLLNSSKTYTEGATPPAPGTAVNGTATGGVKTRLPPGGAWEMVEPSEAADTPPQKLETGAEAVRRDVHDILTDPLQLLASLSLNSAPSTPIGGPCAPAAFSPRTASPAGSPAAGTRTPKADLSRARSVRTERRREKFAKVLKGRQEEGSIEQSELKRLAWSGIPAEVRPIVWQLLLNYLPLASQPRLSSLTRKRKEYSQLVTQYFARGLGGLDQAIWHQIEIDVPRTRPGVPLWACTTAQKSLERILYVWAIRHPASGYVQGINDLVCPFFQVFLGAYIDGDPELFDVAHLPADALAAIEADTFWCLSKLLDGIQDNYISQQPGIQRLVKRMSELVKRIDAPLAAHFEEQGVEFMQFAFRWMNCLLMREMSVTCTIRMWDTYLAEGTDAFSQFHLYVCSALLVKYSERLREMDFQEMIMFLQRLPTHSWTDHDVELLLSEAFVLKTVWQGAENHFANMPQGQGGFGMLGR